MGTPFFLSKESLAALWARAIRPRQGFQDRFLEGPALAEALRGLLVLRSPVTLLGMVLGYVGFQGFYARLSDPGSALWEQILQALPETVEPQALKEALAQLPALPSLLRVFPAMVLLAPLAVASLWLHHATMDHLGLWVLGGLGGRRGFRASLVAEAEALKVGVLGALLGLVSGLGPVWYLVLVVLYFWLLRGFALAAWHGCPLWKGVTATVLNAVFAAGLVLFLVAACAFMVLMAV